MCALAPVMIEVSSAWVQRIYLAPTIKYTKDKGYDVRPGDFVNVARGPEYQATGVVHSVDLLTARLALISQTDKSIVSLEKSRLEPLSLVTDQRSHKVRGEDTQRKYGYL